MRVAITGATGFIGRYLVQQLVASGHECRCWYRPGTAPQRIDTLNLKLEWLPGELGNDRQTAALVDGCDAVVHGALYHPGGGFRGG